MKNTRTMFVVLCASALVQSAANASAVKKFVAQGWEFNEAWPKDFLAAADEFDKTALDGVTDFFLPAD